MFRAFGTTDRGRVRPTNEDCFGISPELQLCLIADGMGGHHGGDVAARLAVGPVTHHVRDRVPPGPRPEYQQGEGFSRGPVGYDRALSEAGNVLRPAVYIANLQILETAVLARE